LAPSPAWQKQRAREE
jgi:hypothetical protein